MQVTAGTKLFVGNLPAATAQPDLEALFLPYGAVLEAVLLPPKGSQSDQRCGFVRMEDLHQATAAIQAVNLLEWGGSSLTVRLADAGRAAARASAFAAQPFGGYPAAAPAGFAISYGGYARAPQYQPPPPRRAAAAAGFPAPGSEAKLFVGNIPAHWARGELEAQFAPFGALEEAVVLPRRGINDTQCGFVKFVDPQSAAYALQTLSGAEVDGTNLVVRFADKGRHAAAPGGGYPMAGAVGYPTPMYGGFQPQPVRPMRAFHPAPRFYRPY